MNYLALGALKHYGTLAVPPSAAPSLLKDKARALKLYKKLRANILRTILSEYHRTGYFWEQYEDSTGKGLRGRPFTGWTALVVNIMAEKY